MSQQRIVVAGTGAGVGKDGFLRRARQSPRREFLETDPGGP